MWRLLSVSFLLLCGFTSFGQEKEISGTLKNTVGDPIPFANIIISDTIPTSRPLTFGYSDEKGNYTLNIPVNLIHIRMNITALGYEEKNILLDLRTVESADIILEESVTRLEEVVVKARSDTDTLDLNIGKMNMTKENTLRDMLNKTDGIIVSEEGGISYQGKQINKVLINGKEVFVHQNKVALDNLNYEIMDNVQIINNYKDKFAIDFDRIRDPVINIDTKSHFKGIVKGQADVGYGFKNRYSVKAKGFFFSDKLNAFATSHTNNTGEPALSQKDVTALLNTYTSETTNQFLSPFFMTDDQTGKNVVSNSSLTLRWQGKNSKTGFVFYHGNFNKEKEIEYRTLIADTLLRKSEHTTMERGHFVSLLANHSHIMSSKTVLQHVFRAVVLRSREYTTSIDTLFVPEVSGFGEQTRQLPKSFSLIDNLRLTRLISGNTALGLSLDYFYEKNSRALDTRLVHSSGEDVFQKSSFKRQYLSAAGELKLRFRKATLNTGLTVSRSEEKGVLDDMYEVRENRLKRNITTGEIPLTLQGSIRKLDYTMALTPVLIVADDRSGQRFLKMKHKLTYNFEAQNNMNLEVDRGYKFFDLNVLYDTIVQTYNQRIINTTDHTLRFAAKEAIALSWYNTNVARARTMNLGYELSREHHFMQSVLDSVSDNVFYYSNSIFDDKYTHKMKAGGKKSLYLGTAYHRLDIGGKLDYAISKYTTVLNERLVNTRVHSWSPALDLGLTPRKFFIKEIKNTTQLNLFDYQIEGEPEIRQSVLTNTTTIEGVHHKLKWVLDFLYRFYHVREERFNYSDGNLSLKYDLSENISLAVSGRSVLTLFGLNNYNFANTTSEGNIVTQVMTRNNLGYLLFYTSFKF
ncbi:carboxypeptidase-like regulatory domain-containing protein [Sinomicrobium oceani]|uniref:carboxypeptidase-like regulatory domain-containing protein n=1 Tax=Sinomicrobium oceani TaxID=1150368 RepID=UPI00227CA08F|nr:carboxypeptidase-like regulatory domain-containing protein [Sinomicrobium oceani]